MGILGTLLEKSKQELKAPDVCIPDHAKPDFQKTEGTTIFPSSFEVDGVYELKNRFTISGCITKGSLKKNSKLVYAGTTIPLAELLLHGKNVDEIEKGEHCAFTIEPEFVVRIKYLDTLRFE